jgi:hypothetical protein
LECLWILSIFEKTILVSMSIFLDDNFCFLFEKTILI